MAAGGGGYTALTPEEQAALEAEAAAAAAQQQQAPPTDSAVPVDYQAAPPPDTYIPGSSYSPQPVAPAPAPSHAGDGMGMGPAAASGDPAASYIPTTPIPTDPTAKPYYTATDPYGPPPLPANWGQQSAEISDPVPNPANMVGDYTANPADRADTLPLSHAPIGLGDTAVPTHYRGDLGMGNTLVGGYRTPPTGTQGLAPLPPQQAYSQRHSSPHYQAISPPRGTPGTGQGIAAPFNPATAFPVAPGLEDSLRYGWLSPETPVETGDKGLINTYEMTDALGRALGLDPTNRNFDMLNQAWAGASDWLGDQTAEWARDQGSRLWAVDDFLGKEALGAKRLLLEPFMRPYQVGADILGNTWREIEDVVGPSGNTLRQAQSTADPAGSWLAETLDPAVRRWRDGPGAALDQYYQDQVDKYRADDEGTKGATNSVEAAQQNAENAQSLAESAASSPFVRDYLGRLAASDAADAALDALPEGAKAELQRQRGRLLAEQLAGQWRPSPSLALRAPDVLGGLGAAASQLPTYDPLSSAYPARPLAGRSAAMPPAPPADLIVGRPAALPAPPPADQVNGRYQALPPSPSAALHAGETRALPSVAKDGNVDMSLLWQGDGSRVPQHPSNQDISFLWPNQPVEHGWLDRARGTLSDLAADLPRPALGLPQVSLPTGDQVRGALDGVGLPSLSIPPLGMPNLAAANPLAGKAEATAKPSSTGTYVAGQGDIRSQQAGQSASSATGEVSVSTIAGTDWLLDANGEYIGLIDPSTGEERRFPDGLSDEEKQAFIDDILGQVAAATTEATQPAPATAPAPDYTAAAPPASNSGGGSYDYGTSYGTSSGGSYDSGSRSSGRRSSDYGGADDSEPDLRLEDFLKDFDGDGEIGDLDRARAKKAFAAAMKRRKGSRGRKSPSNVPARPESPLRTQILDVLAGELPGGVPARKAKGKAR